MRILVVEDHQLVRSGLTLLVQALGMEIVGQCSLASECLTALANTPCDAILLDFKLPDLDAVSLLTTISSDFPRVPVLVLSCYEDVSTAVQSIRAGARGFLGKSATDSDLRVALETVAQGGCYLHPKVAAAVLSELRKGPAKGWDALTPREKALIEGVVAGNSNAELAKKLDLSLSTVKSDLSDLFRRLGLPDRTELALEATRRQARGE